MITRCLRNQSPLVWSLHPYKRKIWSQEYSAKYTEQELNEKIRRLRNFERSEISRTMTTSTSVLYS